MPLLTPYLIPVSAWPPSLLAQRDAILQGLGALGSRLTGQTIEAIAQALEVVNSYYSNRMEGNPTRIGEIFESRDGGFSSGARDPRLEHIAHLGLSKFVRDSAIQGHPCSREFLSEVHRRFYEAMPEPMRRATRAGGATVPVQPGGWRSDPATVGLFATPPPHQIPDLMEEFERAYDLSRIQPTERLGALAAAHHRFLWIHPFADGNGRVARLMTEAMSQALDLDGHRLYSFSRGLARRRAAYDAALSQADAERRNDLDGRGNLSEQGLMAWTVFFVETLADQIRFMGEHLEHASLRRRWQGFLAAEMASGELTLSEASVLRALFDAGEISRGQVGPLAGVKRRQGATIGRRLLDLHLAQSSSPKGPLRLKISGPAARALFPDFF